MMQATVHECNIYRQTGKLPDNLKKESESVAKPNSTSNKTELQAWLDQHDVEYDEDATNAELYDLVKQEAQ